MALDVQPQAAACGQLSYLLTDPRTRCCAVVDPLPETADTLACSITSNDLICEWVLSTSDAHSGGSAARAFAERFLCSRTGGPAAPEGDNAPGYDVAFTDDQRFSIGHVHGRVWLGSDCASFVFDGLILSGCPVGAMATVGRRDALNRLRDDCCVMLHKPLDPARPYSGYRSSLGELKQLGVFIG